MPSSFGGNVIVRQDRGRSTPRRNGTSEMTMATASARHDDFESVFRSSPMAAYRSTPEGRIVAANLALAELLGHKGLKQILGLDLTKNVEVPGFTRKQLVRRLEQAGEMKGLETIWTRADGSSLIARENVWSVRDASGAVAFHEGTVVNITDRKVDDANRVFRTVFESVPLGIAQEALSGGFLQSNRTFQDSLGYAEEELRKTDHLKLIHPDDRAKQAAILKVVQSGQRESVRLEHRHRHKKGHYIWVEETVTLVRDPRHQPAFLNYMVEDVTERRRIQEELREQVALHGVLFQALSDAGQGLAILDWDHKQVRYVNNALADLAGFHPTELRSFERLVSLLPDGLDTAPSEGPSRPHETRLTHRDGRSIDVEITSRMLGTESARLIVATVRDITERKRNERSALALVQEQAARELAEQARLRADLVAEASLTLGRSLDHRATSETIPRLCVPRLADWCAVDLQEPDGSLRRRAALHRDPSRTELVLALPRHFPPDPTETFGPLKTLRTGKTELVSRIPDAALQGNTRGARHRQLLAEVGFANVLYVPLIARGRTLGVLTLARADAHREFDRGDVSLAEEFAQNAAAALDNALLYREVQHELQQRRAAQEELHRNQRELSDFFENSPVAIQWVSEDGVVLRVNQALLDLLGHTREDYAGKPFANFCVDPGLVPGLLEKLARGETVRDFELRLRARGGGIRNILVDANVLWDGPQYIHARWFLRDVTERKRVEDHVQLLNANLEQRVRQRTAELEAANKELEAFAYTVSHDLRAPLRSIEGFSKLILDEHSEALGEEGRRLFQRVRQSTLRMAQLIDDLLNLARMTRTEVRRERVDLTGLARSLIDQIVHRGPARTVEWVVQPEMWAYGDPQLLRVILDNLLRNAWKFTSKHPTARIEIGCEHVDGQTVYFVKDDGAGFDMAFVDKLFQPFQRLHAVTEFDGTGVGLATVARIVGRHGGKVWAEAQVDRGATFRFTL